MAAKYWHWKRHSHLVYYFKGSEVWWECLGGVHRYDEGKYLKGNTRKTYFNMPKQDSIQKTGVPYDIFLLIKQHDRYDIRKELLKDILIDIAANIAPLKVG